MKMINKLAWSIEFFVAAAIAVTVGLGYVITNI